VSRREQSARGAGQQGCFHAPLCTAGKRASRAQSPVVFTRSCCLPCGSHSFFDPPGLWPDHGRLVLFAQARAGQPCRAGPKQACRRSLEEVRIRERGRVYLPLLASNSSRGRSHSACTPGCGVSRHTATKFQQLRGCNLAVPALGSQLISGSWARRLSLVLRS